MSAKSSHKGARGEREFARTLGSLIGEPDLLERNLEQRRCGGDDLRIRKRKDAILPEAKKILDRLNNFSIEVKRHATAKPSSIANWWRQSVAQSRDFDPFKQPLLAYRLDREQWLCVVHISNEIPLEDLRGCLTMNVALFAEFLRRGMPSC